MLYRTKPVELYDRTAYMAQIREKYADAPEEHREQLIWEEVAKVERYYALETEYQEEIKAMNTESLMGESSSEGCSTPYCYSCLKQFYIARAIEQRLKFYDMMSAIDVGRKAHGVETEMPEV